MNPADIRNIVILGQNGTGKTSLTDLLAYQAKAVGRWGKVADGTSVSDHHADEIERKMSMQTALVSFEHRGKRINLLDTPGFPDFLGEPLSAIRAAEVGLVVLSPDQPLAFAVRRFVKECRRNGLGLAFFVNKMDRDGADFGKVFEELKAYLKAGVAPVGVPAGSGAAYRGVVDVLNMRFYGPKGDGTETETEIPEDLKGLAADYRKRMVEAVAECDDRLMEKYFETETLTDEELREGFVAGLESGKLVLVFAGSAEKGSGAAAVLDTAVNDLPSPVDRPPVEATDAGKPVRISCDPQGPLAALVFKTAVEPHMGDMAFVRVFSGTLKTGADVKDMSKNVVERVGQMFLLTGKERREVREIPAGGIGVVVKLKDPAAGHSLCDPKSELVFPDLELPKPVLDVALVPKEKADEDRLGPALHKILQQDPTLRVRQDAELKQTILSGLGEQQLEAVRRLLRTQFHVNVEFERPKVAYRETIRRTAKAQGKHKKQTGGHGQYGDCWVELSPLPLDHPRDFEFEDRIVGGKIPSKYIPAVEKGIREAMERGIVSGHKVIKVKAAVFDGSYHEVDSSDLSFQIAGSLAFRNAAEQASPVVLEPVNRVKILVSEAYLGDVMGDLNGRRGKIVSMEDEDDLKAIVAFVPDAEMYKYSNDLRSLTQGTGTFEMAFDHYQEAPPDVAAKVIEEYRRSRGQSES